MRRMTEPRLTGRTAFLMSYDDDVSDVVTVSAQPNAVYIDGVLFRPQMLRFLADLAETDRHGNQVPHTMSQCYWVDCPEHKCEYTMSHLRDTCGRPTCRES